MTDNASVLSDDILSLKELINTIPTALLIVGPDHRIISGNAATFTQFNRDAAEIINQDIGALFVDDGTNPGIREYIRKTESEEIVSGGIRGKKGTHESFSAKITLKRLIYENSAGVLITIHEEQNTEQLTILTRDCPYALLTLGPDLSVLDANPAFSVISGYSHDETIRMNLKDFTAISRDGPTVDEAIKNRKAMGGRIISRFPSGIKHMQYTYIPVFDIHGDLIRVFDIFADVTPLVTKIRESASLVRENPASILTVDQSGKILSVNPSFTTISGLSEEKLLSMNVKEFTILQYEGATFADVQTSNVTGKGRVAVDLGLGIKILDFTYIPVIDANDEVISIVAMYIDITEQVGYLEQNEVFIKENSNAILTIDPDLNIINQNPAFSQITGYSLEEGTRMKLSDIKVVFREGDTIEEARKTKKPVRGKIIADFPNGIRHLEYVYIPVVDRKGTVIRFFEVFADVTLLVNKITESASLVRENPASILTLEPNGKILSVNPAFIGLSRLSEEKLLSMRLQDFTILERDGAALSEILTSKATMRGKLVVDFGWGIKTLEFTYIPVTDANNTVTSLVAMYVDVTEQIAYKEEIACFIRDNPHAILTMNPDLSITNINPAFSQITGYSLEEGTRMKLSDFNVVTRDGGSADEVRMTKKPTRGKIVVNFPSGIRHLDYVYIPIVDRKGTITRFFEIFSDLTTMVDQINESETLVTNNPASIVSLDITGTILSVNQAFIQLCQVPETRLLSMKITEFNIVEREGTSFSEVLSSKKPGKGSLTVDFGTRINILEYTYIPVMDVNGTVQKVVAMYIDVTAIKRMVQYLERSVAQLQTNITSISQGDTGFTPTVLDADAYTASAREQFVRIRDAIDTAREAIARLVDDSTAIAAAALTGDLQFRSDPKVHHGDYRKIIEGMNQTLDSISIPINESMRVANQYATYDFTARYNPSIPTKGDWIAFKDALNGIGNQVSDVVVRINKEVTSLTANAEEAQASAQEIAEGANLMATNAGRVSTNSEEGKTGALQILNAMEDLTITVGEVSQKTENVSSIAQNANVLAKKGSDMAQKADAGMEIITSSTREMTGLIGRIQQDMNEIGKIVGIIKDIASQTNLLALNAAIEAARAGDAGRGFAVVAAEVKSLAQESRKSAENIAEMIGSLQSKSVEAGKSSEITAKAVAEGNTALTETLKAFGELVISVEEISTNIEQVASMSEEQAASTEEIAASVQEVSRLLEGTSKEAVEMAGITEETAASLDQLRNIIQNVNAVTENVSGAVSRFTI